MTAEDKTSWIEIDRAALAHNARQFLGLCDPGTKLAAVVKANAYGHGLVDCSRVFLEAGASWLAVNSLDEAVVLRAAGIKAPVYIMGFVPEGAFPVLARLGDCRIVLYRPDLVRTLSDCVMAAGAAPVPVHLKVETGNNRQGLGPHQVLELAREIAGLPGVVLEGISSHYADIEDTTDHHFANSQLQRFLATDRLLRDDGLTAQVRHFSNSAATMLWQNTHFELIRVGISLYGMWPSKETYISALVHGLRPLSLKPAMTWKCRIAQVKEVSAGEFVGYGRSFRTTHSTRLGILPVGYYEGYDRSLGNKASVIVRGRLAPVRGRICMNMCMVDLSDIPEAVAGDEVILLGAAADAEGHGTLRISAENLGEWADTINYEITTRINEGIPRRYVGSAANV